MPDNNVRDAYTDMFTAEFSALPQQTMSRLLRYVNTQPNSVRGENVYFDQIGETQPELKTARNQPTPNMNIEHTRRRFTWATYHWATLIDDDDVKKMDAGKGEALSPTYAKAARRGFRRKQDDIIIAAMLGTSYSIDRDGNVTAHTLPSTQKVLHQSAGLTFEKVAEGVKILRRNEVLDDEEGESDIYAAVSAEQIDDLMKEVEYGSGDYNALRPLQEGKIVPFMGVTWIHSERLPVDGSNNRRVPLWVPSGIGYHDTRAGGEDGEGIYASISPRPDLSDAEQIYMRLSLGATRIDELRTVEIACVE